MIDTHLHPLAADAQRYPIAPIGSGQSDWSKGMHLSADAIVAHMANADVELATLVQASSVYGTDNRFVADSCPLYPHKFVGVCCINPLLPDAASTLSYWVEQRGMRGLRLFTLANPSGSQEGAEQTYWLDDPHTDSVWVRAQELDIPIAIQVSMSGLAMVRVMLTRFPKVRVVLDHLAGPTLADGPPYRMAEPLLALSRFPNLHLKFTTVTIRAATEGLSTTTALFTTLLNRFGPRRLLWGSNFPATRGSGGAAYKELVDEARAALAFLSATDREQLFSGTARSLYPALGGA